MSKILLPGDVWTSQPQYPVQVDRSGNLFDPSKITCLINPGASRIVDAVTGKLYTVSTNPSVVPTIQGNGIKWVEASDSYIEIASDADTILDTVNCTMIVATVRTSATTATAPTYGYDGGGGPDRVLTHLPYTDNNIYWDFGNATAGAGGGRVSVGGSAYSAAGTVSIWGFVAGSRGREIWRNGIRIASDAAANFTRTSTAHPFRIGAAYRFTGASGFSVAHTCSLFLISKEQWSITALSKITANPNLVYAPQQRNIWVDVSGGTSVSVDVTGLTGTTALGDETVTAIQNASTSVTGLTGTSALGTVSVTAIQNASTSVTGLIGTSALGSVTVDVGGSTSVSVTGLLGTSALGTVSVTAVRNTSTSVTGLLGTSALGSVTVTTGSGADVSVNVTGLSGTASLGTVLVWGLVDTAQTPNWLAISITQTPNWTRIAT